MDSVNEPYLTVKYVKVAIFFTAAEKQSFAILPNVFATNIITVNWCCLSNRFKNVIPFIL